MTSIWPSGEPQSPCRKWREPEAVLDYAETQVAYARVDAPIAGTVASVSTQEGETVAASFATPTFVTLLDLNRLEVWAYVDETDIGRIRVGQNVRFTVDTYGSEGFTGHVSEIYPQPEIRDNVVDYVTVVRFRAPAGRSLRPEMTTAVRIATEEARNVLTVPLKAVHRERTAGVRLAPAQKRRQPRSGDARHPRREPLGGRARRRGRRRGRRGHAAFRGDVMIELQEIDRTYTRPDGDRVSALSDVSLRIERGDFVAVVGASGSGKSTLMNILGLLDRPTAGRYLLDGRDVADLSPRRTGARAQSADRLRVSDRFTCWHAPARSRTSSCRCSTRIATSIHGLGRTRPGRGRPCRPGSSTRRRSCPAASSSASRSRAHWSTSPDLILADEPTGNLDAQSANEIMALFDALNRAGRTIVLVTHDAALAAQCRRVVRLTAGRLEDIAMSRTRLVVHSWSAAAPATGSAATFMALGSLIGVTALTLVVSLGEAASRKVINTVHQFFGGSSIMVIAGGSHLLGGPRADTARLTIDDLDAVGQRGRRRSRCGIPCRPCLRATVRHGDATAHRPRARTVGAIARRAGIAVSRAASISTRRRSRARAGSR